MLVSCGVKFQCMMKNTPLSARTFWVHCGLGKITLKVMCQSLPEN